MTHAGVVSHGFDTDDLGVNFVELTEGVCPQLLKFALGYGLIEIIGINAGQLIGIIGIFFLEPEARSNATMARPRAAIAMIRAIMVVVLLLP